MKTLIRGGKVYRDGAFTPEDVLVEDERIRAVGTDVETEDAQTLDATGLMVLPGFLDIHTHGAVGVDVNGATVADYQKLSAFYASQGVTGFLCSILTDTREQTLWAIGQAKRAMRENREGATLLGIHLEGPFLAAEYKGAMPEALLQKGSAELAALYQEAAEGAVRYMTVSPEVPGVAEMIAKLNGSGIVIAIGHSGATYDQAMLAIQNGAACATHTMNAMRLLHQHEPAILGAVLETDVYAEAICDGRHLHPGSVRLLLKVKGNHRLIAVTDSIMAAGLPDGEYHLGVNAVTVKDGDAKLTETGTRAGSTLTSAQALRNLVAFTRKPIEELVPLLTENPADLLGLWQKGRIREGADADLVLLRPQGLEVCRTIVRGRSVYES